MSWKTSSHFIYFWKVPSSNFQNSLTPLIFTSDKQCRHATLSDEISSKMVICMSNQTDFDATPICLHHIFLCRWVAVYDSDLRLSSACQRKQSFKWNTFLLWKFCHISGRMRHVCMACLAYCLTKHPGWKKNLTWLPSNQISLVVFPDRGIYPQSVNFKNVDVEWFSTEIWLQFSFWY